MPGCLSSVATPAHSPAIWGARLALLNRGQGWVVRKLQALRCCVQQQAIDAAAGRPTQR